MRVLVVPNTGNKSALIAARDAAKWLTDAGHEAVLVDNDAEAAGLGSHAIPLRDIGQPALAVALGGDGTVLKALHLLGDARTHVLGVNLGRLGFLCGASGEQLIEALAAVVEGKGVIEQRSTLDVSPVMGGRSTGTHIALNEVYVGRSSGMRAVELEIALNGTTVQRMVCDGVIVATPTGSTAYALSAGGPVLSPALEGILLVAVAPHTLGFRPIVLGPDETVTLSFPEPSRSGACLAIDGDHIPCRSQLERVDVRRGVNSVSLVKLDGREFFSAFRETFL